VWHFVVLIVCAVVIYLACEWFVNAVEWLGLRLNVGKTAVGTILAAFGTALPESVVTVTNGSVTNIGTLKAMFLAQRQALAVAEARATAAEADARERALGPALVGHRDHRRLADGRVVDQLVLELDRGDPLAA